VKINIEQREERERDGGASLVSIVDLCRCIELIIIYVNERRSAAMTVHSVKTLQNFHNNIYTSTTKKRRLFLINIPEIVSSSAQH
jgi:hypothetical protein